MIGHNASNSKWADGTPYRIQSDGIIQDEEAVNFVQL
jgi:hypothetical protein